jgi:hypothetical protein
MNSECTISADRLIDESFGKKLAAQSAHEVEPLKLEEVVLAVHLLTSGALPGNAKRSDHVSAASGSPRSDQHWSKYYATLPASMEHMPAYRSERVIAAVQHSFVGGWIKSQTDEFRREFRFICRTLPEALLAGISFEAFLWARCIVSSRAFRLPDPKSGRETLYLIPVIDMLNHSTVTGQPGHANYSMGSCGKLNVTATGAVPAGCEVTISYSRSIEALYVLYGFIPTRPTGSLGVLCTGYLTLSLPQAAPAPGNKPTDSKRNALNGYKTLLWNAASKVGRIKSSGGSDRVDNGGTAAVDSSYSTGNSRCGTGNSRCGTGNTAALNNSNNTAAAATKDSTVPATLLRVDITILDGAHVLSLLRLIVANEAECALLQRQGTRVRTAYDIGRRRSRRSRRRSSRRRIERRMT